MKRIANLSLNRFCRSRGWIQCALAALGLIAFGDSSAFAETNRIEDAPDLQITRLADGVWLHTSWQVLPGGMRCPSNGLLVRESGVLVLIDTAWGLKLTRELLMWIEREVKLPVVRAIVTHAHNDRMGGVAVLADRGISVFSHPLTGALAAKQGWPRPTPLAALNEPGSATQVGEVEVFYPGPAHTVDNVVVWIPRTKILFGACAVKDMGSRTLGNTADADITSWPEAIRRVQRRYDCESVRVVPGHGEVGGSELLRHTLASCEGRGSPGASAKSQPSTRSRPVNERVYW